MVFLTPKSTSFIAKVSNVWTISGIVNTGPFPFGTKHRRSLILMPIEASD